MSAPWYNIGMVFIMGVLGIWKAIPLGFLLGLNPVYIFLATFFGASAGILSIYFMGSRIKEYVIARMDRKGIRRRKGQVDKLLQQYGKAGLGLIGPLVIGPNATMALGIVLIDEVKKLLVFTVIGTAAWSTALTMLGVISIELFSILFLNK